MGSVAHVKQSTHRAGRPILPLVASAVAIFLLTGCESARFGGRDPGPSTRTRAAAPSRPVEPEVAAVPSGSVTSEPLAPLAGAPPEPAPAQSPTVIASLPPASSPPIERVAPTPSTSGSGGRSGAVGAYTAQDASGATCRVNLSSTPALDLYKASASGCSNKDLARISAWDYRDGEVYLYQPGGAVAARLRSGAGQLSGVVTKSGAPLTLAR